MIGTDCTAVLFNLIKNSKALFKRQLLRLHDHNFRFRN